MKRGFAMNINFSQEDYREIAKEIIPKLLEHGAYEEIRNKFFENAEERAEKMAKIWSDSYMNNAIHTELKRIIDNKTYEITKVAAEIISEEIGDEAKKEFIIGRLTNALDDIIPSTD